MSLVVRCQPMAPSRSLDWARRLWLPESDGRISEAAQVLSACR